MVLVGQERVGKSSAGNVILGKEEFNSEISLMPLTLRSEKANCPRLSVVDTPGLCSSSLSPDEVKAEMQRAVELSSPGPHVFLLTLQLGRFTQQEKRGIEMLQEMLSPKVSKYTMILFTYGDRLEETGTDIDEFVKGDQNLQKLLQSCSGMYHVFNEMENRQQVQDLLDKIYTLSDGGRHYYQKESGLGSSFLDYFGTICRNIPSIIYYIGILCLLYKSPEIYNGSRTMFNNLLDDERQIKQVKK